jgi:tetratricopeptide (TPR) repeat protein
MGLPQASQILTPAPGEKVKERLYIGLLLAIVVFAYGNTLVNAFTMDDIALYVVRNTQVTHPSLPALFAPHQATNVFRPVTFSTFALDWKLGGGRPFLFHLVNLVLHAAVTWLLYLLLQTVLRSSPDGKPDGKTVAFACALLFAVHPIHTEAVASIVGRAELLAAGFLLAAWILHLRDREISALICFVLALLSKESAVVFLPLAAIGDYASGKWKPASRYLRIAGLTLLYLGVLWKVQGGHFGMADIQRLNNPLATIPTGWRILNALRVAWKYVGLQFYPATLSCDYSFNQIPVYLDWRHTLPAAIAAVAAVGGWTWAIWKRRYAVVLAGAIYLAGFCTTANILVPIGTIMGERLAYLPSAGFCLLIALAWNWLQARQRKLALLALAVFVAVLGARTVVRNRDWKDNLTLYSAAVRAVPRSAKMHEALGATYVELGQLDLARKELQIALSIEPDFPYALEAYGLVESWKHNYQAAGPLLEKAFHLSRRDDPNYDDMAVNLAAVYLQTDQASKALDLLNREISEAPGYARAWSNRAVLRYKGRETALARADAETALRLDPSNKQAQNLMQLLNTSSPSNVLTK